MGALCALLALLPAAAQGVAVVPQAQRIVAVEGDGPVSLDLADPRFAQQGDWVVTIEELGVDLVARGTAAGRAPGPEVGSPLDGSGTIFLVLRGPLEQGEIQVRQQSPQAGGGRLAVRVRPAAGDFLAAADAMQQAGAAAQRDGGADRQAAVAGWERAQQLWSLQGERRFEAEAAESRGLLLRRSGEVPRAAEALEEAFGLWSRLGNVPRTASVLNDLGLAWRELGEDAAARTALEAALELHRSLGNRRETAAVRNNLCMIDHAMGALRPAAACYEQVLVAMREAGDPAAQAAVLNNLGFAWDGLGEPQAARRAYGEAVELRRRLGDHAGVAQVLNNLAGVDRRTGDLATALDRYLEAAAIYQRLDDGRNLAKVHNNLGTVYRALGDGQRARSFYRRALDGRRRSGDRSGALISLNNLGSLLSEDGDSDGALKAHLEALEIADRLAREWLRATTLEKLGRAQLQAGEAAAARRSYAQALAVLAPLGHRLSAARARLGRGEALLALGERLSARDDLRTALEAFRELSDPLGAADALLALARWERGGGSVEAALARIDEAELLFETLRARLAHPRLAASLASRRAVWELRIELQMELAAVHPGGGHELLAFAAGEVARARALRDVLADPRGPAAASSGPRREAAERLAAKLDRMLQLADEAGGEAAAAELAADVDRLEAELDRLERGRPPGDIDLSPLSIEGLQQLLDEDTALVVFSLGEARSFAWRLTAEGLASFRLPARSQIETAAARLHEDLRSLDADPRPERARNLSFSRLLLGDLLDGLEARRLAVVADGGLHFVPFGVLLDPSIGAGEIPRPLLDRFEIVHLPSASVLGLQRRRASRRSAASKGPQIVLLGDPLFAPAAVASGGIAAVAGLEPLPATRAEVREIAALAAPAPALVALGADASRDLALGPEVAAARFVHLATHGVFDGERPELSGLVFSQLDGAGRPRPGFVSIRDLYQLRLEAELVTLSACSSALGRQLRGEGLVGLTHGFFHAGARRVLASLWQVRDRATGELMVRFYRALWEDRLPPAGALRRAQQELRSDPRYRDAYYWGAFVLAGDWR